jgi:hypothetical protein
MNKPTLFYLERGLTFLEHVSGPFKDLLWWLEVLEQFRMWRG